MPLMTRPWRCRRNNFYPLVPGFCAGTRDVSPPGEVLYNDGKYPKIPGSADPDPGRTFRSCPKFVRRGHKLGAAASSARCRSHLSNSRFPSFPPRASCAPCLFGFVRFVPRSMQGPMIPTPSGLIGPPSPLGGEGSWRAATGRPRGDHKGQSPLYQKREGGWVF